MDEDVHSNLEAMETLGCRVMVRGHDHHPHYIVRDAGGKLSGGPPKIGGDGIPLDCGCHYVLNPGAIYKGNYAVIDTGSKGQDMPRVTYHTV
jgi:hypothetical protein